jgi:glucose-1-phosphate thymidylyltransferase
MLKGLILSGGHGMRLRPLSEHFPKQAMPVGNRPIIHYVVDNLIKEGIVNIGVVLSPETAEHIKQTLNENPWGANFEWIVQSAPLGLAHAVGMAREFIGSDSFVVYLGDNMLGDDIGDLVRYFNTSGSASTIALKAVDEPSAYGVAEVDSTGKVERVVEKPAEPKSNLAVVGIYCFTPEIFEMIDQLEPSPRGELEITDAIQSLVNRNALVTSMQLDKWWLDCGTPSDFLNANDEILKNVRETVISGETDLSTQITGSVFIAKNATVISSELIGPLMIGEGAKILNSRIGPNVSIGKNSTIDNSTLERVVVFDSVNLNKNSHLIGKIIAGNGQL